MKKWLRVVWVLHAAFFALWAIYLLNSHRSGQAVWLETVPVDPRDYLSGHYVVLNFRISNPDTISCPDSSHSGGRVYVRLAESTRTIATEEGTIHVWDPTRCQTEMPPTGSGGVWVEGRRIATPQWAGWRQIQYGIERFYVSEHCRPVKKVS